VTRLLINPPVEALQHSSSSSSTLLSLVYAGSPTKATAIEATAQQVPEYAFQRALLLAAVSTGPLIKAQQALAAAAAAAAGSSRQQQQRTLPLLLPALRLQEAVRQLAERPLRALFTQHGSNGGSSDTTAVGGAGTSSSSSSSSNKLSRAASLAAIQQELLADLQRMGLLPEGGQPGTAAAAAAAGGMYTREDALRAFDSLQSRVMRDLLLESEVGQGG